MAWGIGRAATATRDAGTAHRCATSGLRTPVSGSPPPRWSSVPSTASPLPRWPPSQSVLVCRPRASTLSTAPRVQSSPRCSPNPSADLRGGTAVALRVAARSGQVSSDPTRRLVFLLVAMERPRFYLGPVSATETLIGEPAEYRQVAPRHRPAPGGCCPAQARGLTFMVTPPQGQFRSRSSSRKSPDSHFARAPGSSSPSSTRW